MRLGWKPRATSVPCVGPAPKITAYLFAEHFVRPGSDETFLICSPCIRGHLDSFPDEDYDEDDGDENEDDDLS